MLKVSGPVEKNIVLSKIDPNPLQNDDFLLWTAEYICDSDHVIPSAQIKKDLL